MLIADWIDVCGGWSQRLYDLIKLISSLSITSSDSTPNTRHKFNFQRGKQSSIHYNNNNIIIMREF